MRACSQECGPINWASAGIAPYDAGYPTLAEAFGARGYATAGFVANPVFCHANYGLGRGFVHYEDIPVSPLEVLRSGNLTAGLLKYINRAATTAANIWGDQSLLFRVLGDNPRASLAESRGKSTAQDQPRRPRLDVRSAASVLRVLELLRHPRAPIFPLAASRGRFEDRSP